MCTCKYCGKLINRPKIGPRKVLESGFLKPTVYDLKPCIQETESYLLTAYYYYNRDMFCPRCGKFLKEIDSYWAEKLGERASLAEIIRNFEHEGQNYWGYPGDIH